MRVQSSHELGYHRHLAVIAHGKAVEKLAKMHTLVPFTYLLCHEELGIEITFRRDRDVAAWCQERGVPYHQFPQSSVMNEPRDCRIDASIGS